MEASGTFEFHDSFSVEEDLLNGLTLCNLYIPEDVLINIFLHLPPKDVLNCSLVCKRWCNIVKSDILWHEIYNYREHPKKAKHLPWYIFYSYFSTDYFKNLIRNGNGQNGFNHWTITSNGGDQFKIESEPVGSPPLPSNIPEFENNKCCFATSYEACCKNQKFELTKNPLFLHIIRKHKPTIYLSEWYCGRYDCSSVYRLSVTYDSIDLSNIEMPSVFSVFRRRGRKRPPSSHPDPFEKNIERRIEQWSDPQWTKVELECDDYPSHDITTVYFCHVGQDTKFWRGHYGSKFAGGVLKFLIDSIKP